MISLLLEQFRIMTNANSAGFACKKKKDKIKQTNIYHSRFLSFGEFNSYNIDLSEMRQRKLVLFILFTY